MKQNIKSCALLISKAIQVLRFARAAWSAKAAALLAAVLIPAASVSCALQDVDTETAAGSWIYRTYGYSEQIYNTRVAAITIVAVLLLLLLGVVLLLLISVNRRIKARELHETELQTILDSVDAGITIVNIDDGKLAYANNAAMELFIYDDFEGQLEGRNVLEFMPEIQPDGKRTADIVKEFWQSGRFTGSFQFYKSTGEPFLAYVRQHNIHFNQKLSSIALIEDLTEENEMIAVMESVLDSIDSQIYVSVPETGELLFVNKKLKSLFGREKDDLSGELCYKVFRNFDEKCDFCPCYQLDENPQQTIMWEEYIESLGRYIRHFDSYIIWPDGRRVHFQNAVDMTDLIKAREEAEKSSRHKTDFLAKMSHEIRTPMNAIIGMTELALREDNPGKIREYNLTVRQAASNLLAIIDDILDFSKIEAGKIELVVSGFSVASLLNDIVSIIRTRVVGTQINFAVIADPAVPDMLYGDETRIRQSVLNILNNAVKYTEKGFVTLGVYREDAGDDIVNLIFEVTDSGIGIKPEDMDSLFSDFTQFNLSENREIEGVGLGLAITHSIIEAMNGNIAVKSEYGEGTTFTISIPLKVHSGEVLAKVGCPADKKVLIYEQRDVYVASLAYAMRELGVNYTIVNSGIDLYSKMVGGAYNFLFISYALYTKNEDIIIKHKKNINITVLAEFGESIPEKYFHALSMPVYCTSIADMLNGVYGNIYYADDSESYIQFTAPDARVLIVDDINTNLKVAEGLLRPYGMRVDLANSGAKAIDAIQAEHYDLVFMDHRMPVMDGMETTKRIRMMAKNDPYYGQIPIVALTANAISGMREVFIENGFNDFLSKPIDTVKLHAILDRWLPKDKQEHS